MNTYVVTVLVDGAEVGTWTVQAPREGLATTRAMIHYLRAQDKGEAPAMASGSFVQYRVTQP